MWGGVGARGGSGGRHDPNRVSGRVLGPLEVPRSNCFAIRPFCRGKPRPPGTTYTPFWHFLCMHLRTQEGPVERARSHTAGCLPLQNTPMAKRFQEPKPTGAAPPENHHFQTPTLPPGPRPTRHTRTTARHDYPSPGAWIAASQRRGCSSGRAGRMGGQDDGTPVGPCAAVFRENATVKSFRRSATSSGSRRSPTSRRCPRGSGTVVSCIPGGKKAA